MNDTRHHSPAVRAVDLSKSFEGHRAVAGVDLEICRGEVFGVLGPNGAGKTTLIRMLATLLPIDGGRAEIFGVDVARHPHRVRRLIGLTGQYASVDAQLTARENLELFSRLHGIRGAAARSRVAELLAEFSLEDAADRAVSKFSGGMRRRLDLAVSLIDRPPLIFLDEPTTGLDPRTRNQMWTTIRTLIDGGSTVLLTTQYLEEADELADRIAVIDHGRVVAQGTPRELKASVGTSSLRVVLTDVGETTAAEECARAAAARASVHVIGPGELRIPLDGPDEAAPLLLALTEARIGLESLEVRQPSLDEVFLTLTGRPSEKVADTLQETSR